MATRDKYFPGTALSRYLIPGERSGLYVIWLSDRHYYGGRTGDFRKRWATHLKALRAGCHGNAYMQNVFNLYGEFRPEILFVIDSEEKQVEAERKWLNENFESEGCVNLSSNAEGGGGRNQEPWSHSEKSRAEISAANRNRPQELKDRLVRAAAQANTGRPLSEEHKETLSRIRKGVEKTPEHRAKIAAALRGRKHSEERKAKVSRALSGRVQDPEHTAKVAAANRGKRRSPEVRKNISEGVRRALSQGEAN